jgi:hypothetical protein
MSLLPSVATHHAKRSPFYMEIFDFFNFDTIPNVVSPIVVLIIVVFLLVRKSVIVVSEDHRVLLFVLGKFATAKGPGVHIIVPFIYTTRIVSLNSALPEWKSMAGTDVLDSVVKKELGTEVFNQWVARGRKPLSDVGHSSSHR